MAESTLIRPSVETRFVRATRPLQSWVSLLSAIAYVFWSESPSEFVIVSLMALPLAYAGLRQIGKYSDAKLAISDAQTARSEQQVQGGSGG